MYPFFNCGFPKKLLDQKRWRRRLEYPFKNRDNLCGRKPEVTVLRLSEFLIVKQ